LPLVISSSRSWAIGGLQTYRHSVVRGYDDVGVHVDAVALAHALRLAGACRAFDTQQRLARPIAREAVARGGRAAEHCERELLAVGLLGVALADAVARAAVAREGLLDASCGAGWRRR